VYESAQGFWLAGILVGAGVPAFLVAVAVPVTAAAAVARSFISASLNFSEVFSSFGRSFSCLL
jgi:hypothetical protein